MTTKIAILGWGSLLWESGHDFDKWHEDWEFDGPPIKLEFSRKSQSRLEALTLVIDIEHGTQTTVAWCLSKRRDLQDAIRDLRDRESTGLKKIARISLSEPRLNHYRNYGCDKVVEEIVNWANEKKLDAIVWTDLSSNFNDFSIQAALSHIRSLSPKGKAKAAEYVWRAPDFVQTELRRLLQQEPWFSPSSRRVGMIDDLTLRILKRLRLKGARTEGIAMRSEKLFGTGYIIGDSKVTNFFLRGVEMRISFNELSHQLRDLAAQRGTTFEQEISTHMASSHLVPEDYHIVNPGGTKYIEVRYSAGEIKIMKVLDVLWPG